MKTEQLFLHTHASLKCLVPITLAAMGVVGCASTQVQAVDSTKLVMTTTNGQMGGTTNIVEDTVKEVTNEQTDYNVDHNLVKEIQELLGIKPADGYFGAQTKSEIEHFLGRPITVLDNETAKEVLSYLHKKAVALPSEQVVLGNLFGEAVADLSLPMVNNTVLFDTASSAISQESQETLNQLTPYIMTSRGNLLVEGHTDSSGSLAYNQRLSVYRANSVKSALINQFIAPSRIDTVGYGPSRPMITPELSRSDKALNRRVEVSAPEYTQ